MGTIRTTSRRRAATTVLAGASVLALAAPSVSAAPNAGPDRFAGRAEALALDLDLNAAGLAGQADTIEQLVSQTLTRLDSEGKVAAKADLLEGLLDFPALESTGGSKSGSTSLANLSEPPLTVRGGTLEYTADVTNRVTRAFSELAFLQVGLANTEEVEKAVEDARTALEKFVGTTPSDDAAAPVTLNELLGGIQERVNLGLPETEQVELPEISLEDLDLQLPDTALTNLATIEKLWSETITQTEDASNKIASTAEAGVTRMSLLGGLVNVPEYVFSSVAKTNGQRGGASAETVTKDLKIQIANSDVIGISGDDLVVEGLPPIDLTGDELGQLSTLLKSILNAVGLDIKQANETKKVADDGSYALASTSPLAISLSPLNVLGAQDPAALNLNLSLLPTLAEVTAANAAPAAQPRPQAPAVQKPAPTKSLPRTGGGAVAVLVGGLAMGGAYALRRFMKS